MKVCRNCKLPWPGDDALSVDDLRNRHAPALPVCVKAPPADRWFIDSGINGHIFDEDYRRSWRSLTYYGAEYCIACRCMLPCGCSDAWISFCEFAFVERWRSVLPILAHNLASAGGLCAAYELGDDGANHPPPWSNGHGDGPWFPGCGRPAPRTEPR